MSGHFIDVILPIPIQKTFTYSVSQTEYEFLKKGMRVAVSFGKTKMYTGLVFKLHQIPPEVYDAKDILQIDLANEGKEAEAQAERFYQDEMNKIQDAECGQVFEVVIAEIDRL